MAKRRVKSEQTLARHTLQIKPSILILRYVVNLDASIALTHVPVSACDTWDAIKSIDTAKSVYKFNVKGKEVVPLQVTKADAGWRHSCIRS